MRVVPAVQLSLHETTNCCARTVVGSRSPRRAATFGRRSGVRGHGTAALPEPDLSSAPSPCHHDGRDCMAIARSSQSQRLPSFQLSSMLEWSAVTGSPFSCCIRGAGPPGGGLAA
jgi:hypothetical protein